MGRARRWARRALLSAALAGWPLAAWPGAVDGQGPQAGREGCDLVESRRLNSILTSEGERITYISGPVVFQCEDGTRVRADSVVDFSTSRFRQLMGGVEIDGPETRLVANRVHQADESGRVQAWGGVELEEKEGELRMVGDSLLLMEHGPDGADDELEMTGGRPYAVLRLQGATSPDSTTGPPEIAGGVAEGRPEADTVDAGVSASSPPLPPDTVFGDRLFLRGESRFAAGGSVRVRRPDLEAFADSLDYDRERSLATLRATGPDAARIEGEEFDLVARTVDLFIEGEQVNEIRAIEEARLTGDDVQVDAPRIRIFMESGEMERLVAIRRGSSAVADAAAGGAPDATVREELAAAVREDVAAAGIEDVAGDSTPEVSDDVSAGLAPKGGDLDRSESREAEDDGQEERMDLPRPVAVAEDFVLRADSIEVAAPGRRLDQVVAVGGARGESLGRDSLNTADTPELIRRDWIEGDTIVAHFVPVDSAGEAGRVENGADEPDFRLDRLVATGNARTLYRMAPEDSVSVVATDGGAGDEAALPADGGVDAGAAGDGAGIPDGAETDSVAAAGPRRDRIAVHYVVGDRITIVLREGEVERMEVEGQTRGIYLEPVAGRDGGRSPGLPGAAGERFGSSPPIPTRGAG